MMITGFTALLALAGILILAVRKNCPLLFTLYRSRGRFSQLIFYDGKILHAMQGRTW
jgi:hypothetical protein